ncbi:hypothetical protein OHAE_1842 [Ochrobactrum soli]|uniref:Uncharacterized protein n=1 Tax=Ochrobactrum soli TaxID=2448455 RepID=A0A2P9HPB4_9HYPH|nr:hypothetical protein OHAE_1842 [[Ochrobactrum] soli]
MFKNDRNKRLARQSLRSIRHPLNIFGAANATGYAECPQMLGRRFQSEVLIAI